MNDRPVGGKSKVGVGAVQCLSSAGMKTDGEGEHYTQGEGFKALSGVCVEHRAGTEAHIGHR